MNTILKGGSLSKTFIVSDNYVRKQVSRTENREYGYVRWYSQLKKMQRMNTLIPGIVPEVTSVGISGDTAYFDMPYLTGYDTLRTVIERGTVDQEKLSRALWKKLDLIHDQYKSVDNTNSPKLYFAEEVLEKLKAAMENSEFEDFFNRQPYSYRGCTIPGINQIFPKLVNYFAGANKIPQVNLGSLIHGNPTLENIMYSETENDIVFIDPYEESILDSRFLDYSMLLQDTRGHYCYLNTAPKQIIGPEVSTTAEIPKNLIDFNRKVELEVALRSPPTEQGKFIDVLHATQFFRMLPFKCQSGDVDGAKFFYVHGLWLLQKMEMFQ